MNPYLAVITVYREGHGVMSSRVMPCLLFLGEWGDEVREIGDALAVIDGMAFPVHEHPACFVPGFISMQWTLPALSLTESIRLDPISSFMGRNPASIKPFAIVNDCRQQSNFPRCTDI